MSKKENKIKGNFGEDLACDFLAKEGYAILDRNFSCAYGEIDIVANKTSEIIFVEVKTRCQSSYGNPIEAVDSNKEYHIYNVAKYYLYKYGLVDAPVRFDIIEIFIYGSNDYKISHIKDIILDDPSKKFKRRKNNV